MPDRGEKYADKKLSQVDRQLRSTYASAQKELQKKLSDFEKRHKANDERKRRERDEGKITEQQYRDWLSGQVFIREQWQSKIDQVCSVMLHHNEIATQIINESRFDTFAENYYAEAFRSQWIVQNISFNVYNTQALARLIKDNPQILPEYDIDKKKDYKWNYKKVNNIIQQGIIQGESVDKICERLCEGLAAQNENKMRMFARTAITGAQNAGRQVQMEQAADMGIEVNKRWIATPDNRTRDSHRAMDGEEVPYNEDFPNGLEYPGDPAGPPEEVNNCRCTMQTVYPKYEDRSKQWREDVEIDGVPYEEWKKYKSYDEYEKATGKKKPEKQAEAPVAVQKNTEKKEKPVERTKRERKPFDINSATDVEKIKKQMIKNGWVRSCGFGSMNIEDVKDIYRTYEDMMNRFPIMKGELSFVYAVKSGMNGLKDGTYANCGSFSGGGISLNLRYFGNIPFFKYSYRSDVVTGWHPQGTDYRAVLYHELGHALDGVLSKKISTNNLHFSGDMLELVLNKDREMDWLPFKDKDIGPLVSRYATKNEKEWFAECVATMMTAEEKDKSSMQKIFEQQLTEFVREL